MAVELATFVLPVHVTTQRYQVAADCAVVYVGSCTPWILVNVFPSELRCHWYWMPASVNIFSRESVKLLPLHTVEPSELNVLPGTGVPVQLAAACNTVIA